LSYWVYSIFNFQGTFFYQSLSKKQNREDIRFF